MKEKSNSTIVLTFNDVLINWCSNFNKYLEQENLPLQDTYVLESLSRGVDKETQSYIAPNELVVNYLASNWYAKSPPTSPKITEIIKCIARHAEIVIIVDAITKIESLSALSIISNTLKLSSLDCTVIFEESLLQGLIAARNTTENEIIVVTKDVALLKECQSQKIECYQFIHNTNMKDIKKDVAHICNWEEIAELFIGESK